MLKEKLFEKQEAEVVFFDGGRGGGWLALFFHNFSTFLGKAGLYWEDFYVKPERRGMG